MDENIEIWKPRKPFLWIKTKATIGQTEEEENDYFSTDFITVWPIFCEDTPSFTSKIFYININDTQIQDTLYSENCQNYWGLTRDIIRQINIYTFLQSYEN